ncbi:MAG: DUF962 domain-containing protein [Casimicrobiaceae bacterium]|nr:DUF962 domain-containing protein [Casimicrobiaceae bacterium]MCX8098612.1 DUF962 domain-containing protein [Casimicrobiaceae bacterium]MDW8312027.1 DUF962 domain-containing protein [Burkholderiales bacterium]
MRHAVEWLTQYAAYHRDRRNIATHFVGIPLIVFALIVLLSRPMLASWAGVIITPALVLAGLTLIYYLWLDWRLGLALAGFFVMGLALAQPIAQLDTALWLGTGIALFVIGWLFQFVGHYYEGRKPAFLDDIMGLLVGPLFVAAEAAFALGLREELKRQIERVVGPVRGASAQNQEA